MTLLQLDHVVAALLLPRAREVLAAAEGVADVVRPVRSLTGGTAWFGTVGSAHRVLLVDLVSQFHERYPGVRVRRPGRSTEVADAVRGGRLEAGLVALPPVFETCACVTGTAAGCHGPVRRHDPEAIVAAWRTTALVRW